MKTCDRLPRGERMLPFQGIREHDSQAKVARQLGQWHRKRGFPDRWPSRCTWAATRPGASACHLRFRLAHATLRRTVLLLQGCGWSPELAPACGSGRAQIAGRLRAE
jgi:hypothetical protein